VADTSAIEGSALERFANSFRKGIKNRRGQLRVSLADGKRHYFVDVLGVNPADRSLLLTAPTTADKSLVAVMRNQALSCRWANSIAVYGFRGLITNLGFDPAPVVHLGHLHKIQRHTQRQLPRVVTALPATLAAARTHAVLVTDLSVGGAQIGISSDLQVQVGDPVELGLRLRLLKRDFVIKLKCTIAMMRGAADPAHPSIHSYGLVFAAPDDPTLLTLHGYVQQMLLEQADQLSQMLLPDSTETDHID
jgi:hypothetical protein